MNAMCRYFFTLLPLIYYSSLFAQVGVNVLNPHPSSALQVASPPGTNKGLLTPSMTTAGRMAMTTGSNNVADGLVVFDADHHLLYCYNGWLNKWVALSPLVLSSPTTAATNYPSGVISTPISSVATTYSLAINKTNPSHVLDVVGSATVSGSIASGSMVSAPVVSSNTLFSNNILVSGFAYNALVPAGTIVMWSGANVPNGWVVCDGTNGTPDLRGRFIVCAGQATAATVAGDTTPNYTLNSKGGVNSHTLSIAELPRHQHEAATNNANILVSGGSHAHNVTPNGQGTGAQRAGGNSGGLASDSPATISTATSTHTHATNEFSGKVGDGGGSGLNNQGHENRPAFYVLQFIMKL
jgi:microcystin-dependent protein